VADGSTSSDGSTANIEGGAERDGSSPVSDAGDAATCIVVMDDFEAASWAPEPRWSEVTEAGGTRSLVTGHDSAKAIRFVASQDSSVASLRRPLTSSTCALRFDAWINVGVASGGDGAQLLRIERASGASTVGLGLYGVNLRINNASGMPVINRTIAKGQWIRIVYELDGAKGEVALEIDGIRDVALVGPGAPTALAFGVLGAADGGEPTDDITYDDVVLSY
jgi:hypothetical protein